MARYRILFLLLQFLYIERANSFLYIASQNHRTIILPTKNARFTHFRTCTQRRKKSLMQHMSTKERGQRPLNFRADDELRAQVSKLIDHMLELSKVTSINPEVLERFIPALTKGEIYSQAMRNKLNDKMSNAEFEKLKKIDAFLKGFISQHKLKRSRETIQEIIGSATESAEEMDIKVGAMSEQGRLDKDCLDYITELVDKERQKQTLPEQSLLLRVLIIVQERIEAEVKMSGRPEVRILSHLVRMDDISERELATRNVFRTREELENFAIFVKDGIDYFNTKGTGVLFASKLPQDAVERMQHISQVVEELMNG